MAAVTICSDFGAQKNKVSHCFHCFPIYFPWSDGARCHDLHFLNVELWAIVNNAAMNMEAQISLWHFAFSPFRYTTRNGISGSHSDSIFNFLRQGITACHSDWTILPFYHPPDSAQVCQLSSLTSSKQSFKKIKLCFDVKSSFQEQFGKIVLVLY